MSRPTRDLPIVHELPMAAAGFAVRFFLAVLALTALLFCIQSMYAPGTDVWLPACVGAAALFTFGLALQSFPALLTLCAGVVIWMFLNADRMQILLATCGSSLLSIYFAFIDTLNMRGFSVRASDSLVALRPDMAAGDGAPLFLMVAAVVFALLAAVFILYELSPFLLGAFFLLPLVPGMIYYVLPDSRAFLLMLCTLLSLYVVRRTTAHGRIDKHSGRRMLRRFCARFSSTGAMGIAALVLSLSLCALLLYIAPPNPQLHVDGLSQAAAGFEKLTSVLSGVRSPLLSGGVNGGLLGQKHPGFTGRRVMTVTTAHRDALYLRSFIASSYDGMRWKEAERVPEDTISESALLADFFTLIYADAELASSRGLSEGTNGLYGDNVAITLDAPAGERLYIPMYPETVPEGVDADRLLPGTDAVQILRSYEPDTLSYTIHAALPDRRDGSFYDTLRKGYYIAKQYRQAGDRLPVGLQTILEKEAAYADYAAVAYTALPEDVPTRVRTLAERIAGDEEENPVNRMLTLANYLATHYEYTLEPAPYVPLRDKDFVDYFLFTEQRGYCVHYASAMVVMARALGFPARYVEGYIAIPGDEDTISVMDSYAHAWPEIYLPGMGWIMFEPTAAYSGRQASLPPLSTPSASEDSISSPEPETTPEPPTPSTDSPDTEKTPVPVPSETDSASVTSPSSGAQANTTLRKPLPGWIWGVLGTLILLLLLFVRRIWAARMRMRRFTEEDAAQAVLSMYAYTERLLRYAGLAKKPAELPADYAARLLRDANISYPDTLFARARFGFRAIGMQEQREAAAACRLLQRTLSAHCSLPRRLLLEYVFGLL